MRTAAGAPAGARVPVLAGDQPDHDRRPGQGGPGHHPATDPAKGPGGTEAPEIVNQAGPIHDWVTVSYQRVIGGGRRRASTMSVADLNHLEAMYALAIERQDYRRAC